MRRLGFFYNSHVPRAGFIIVAAANEAYQAIWDHLLSERNSWDLLQLCQLPEGSQTAEEMRRLAGEAGFPIGIWLSGASPYMSFDTSWSQYYDRLPTKHRSNLSNRFKRLNQIGPVESRNRDSGRNLWRLPWRPGFGWRNPRGSVRRARRFHPIRRSGSFTKTSPAARLERSGCGSIS